ncbi:hypothetical protein IAU59_005695 [Kwoniella sp. CBS 9459]
MKKEEGPADFPADEAHEVEALHIGPSSRPGEIHEGTVNEARDASGLDAKVEDPVVEPNTSTGEQDFEDECAPALTRIRMNMLAGTMVFTSLMMALRSILQALSVASSLVTLGLSLLMFSLTRLGSSERGGKPIISHQCSNFPRCHYSRSAGMGLSHQYPVAATSRSSARMNAVYILLAAVAGISISFAVIPMVQLVGTPLLLAPGGICIGLANALFAWPTHTRVLLAIWVLGRDQATLGRGFDHSHRMHNDLKSLRGLYVFVNDEQSVCGALFSVSLQRVFASHSASTRRAAELAC